MKHWKRGLALLVAALLCGLAPMAATGEALSVEEFPVEEPELSLDEGGLEGIDGIPSEPLPGEIGNTRGRSFCVDTKGPSGTTEEMGAQKQSKRSGRTNQMICKMRT